MIAKRWLGYWLAAMAPISACGDSGGGTGDGGAAGTGGDAAPLGPPYHGPPGEYVDRTPSPIPGTWPPEYSAVGIAYDDEHGKVYVVTADTAAAIFELWEWDTASATFTQRTPAAPFATGAPTAQGEWVGAYDASRGVVVFHSRDDACTVEYDVNGGSLTTVEDSSDSSFRTPIFYDPVRQAVLTVASDKVYRWEPSAPGWTLVPLTIERPAVDCPFDTARRVLHCFGSNTPNGPTEVYEVDIDTGAATVRTPPTLPASWPGIGEVGRLAVYDSDRDVVVAVPTFATTSVFEWSPATGVMERLDPPSVPSSSLSFVYDASAGLTVGVTPNGDGYLEDMVTWDGSTFTGHRPAKVPLTWPVGDSAGILNSATRLGPFPSAYDPDRGRFVASFRSRQYGSPPTTLEWDGEAWTDRTSGISADTPFEAMAYDTKRHRMMLLGLDGSGATSLWAFDGEAGAWAEIGVVDGEAGVNTEAGGMVFDPVSDQLLVVGDGSAWVDPETAVATRIPIDYLGEHPEVSFFSALTYDERRDVPILITDTGQPPFAFDRAAQKWVPEGDPAPAPEDMKAIYDRVRGEVILVGAFGFSQLEVRAYDPDTGHWSDQSPTAPPWWKDENVSPISGFAYDAKRETLMLVLTTGQLIERPSR
jgi:hypothetical protein